jgi:cobalt-zinc-cadmium efflux system outer membrane protein
MRLTILLLLCTTLAASEALDGLVDEVLANNPEILAAQKRVEAARQRPSRVSSLPDPMFSPGYSSNGAPWPGAGLGREPTSNIGFMVSQQLPYPGKRKLAGDMAEREAEAEFQDWRQVQWRVVSRLKQAWYRRAYVAKAIEVIDHHLDLFDRLRRVTEARYAVGRAAQQDVLKAQTQISILQTRRLQLERERASREFELMSLLARRASETLPPTEPLMATDVVVPLDELFAAAKESPVLRREEKMIQRAEVALNMARKDYYPDYTVNAGYATMGRMPDMFQLRVDVNVPLWFFRKQRAGVAEQASVLAGSRKTYEAAGRELQFRIKDEYLMAQTSAQLVKIYGEAVIPQASLTLESSLSSYETGAVDFLTVLMNIVTVVEYEMNYWEELQSYYLSMSRLEEMTGRRLIR